MIFIGIDDTDNIEGGGTGRVAREIAADLSRDLTIRGVSRHQLLVDDRVPYTSNNSCNVIHIVGECDKEHLRGQVESLLLGLCLEGSDPGLCIGSSSAGTHAYGQSVQRRIVSQDEAFAVARELSMILRPLGGTGDGIIGALAGVILAAGGNDGRFVEVGRTREITGVVLVAELLASGVKEVRTLDGMVVIDGEVDTRDRVRPVLCDHQPVLLVERNSVNGWQTIQMGKGRKRKEDSPCRQ